MEGNAENCGGLLSAIGAHQQKRGGPHCAGTLASGPLKTILWYLEVYFAARPVRVIETGCGASTILFSHYAGKHYSFCYDDRECENSSVSFVTEFPEFRAEKVEWVFGPTQLTVPQHTISEPVDILLIDGPHGFPFPELEYYYFYRLLQPNSILIVDDIHIPTLKNLFNFLCQDDMFYLHQVTATTAFFVRTAEPMLNPLGDDWWKQRYNIQHFPAYDSISHHPAYKLPVRLSMAGRFADLDHLSPRGIIFCDGRLTTEGKLAWIRLPVECENNRDLVVDLDIEFVAPEERPGAGFELLLNNNLVQTVLGSDAKRRVVTGTTVHKEGAYLEIKFHSFGLKHADELKGFPSASFDQREPGIIIHSVHVRRASDSAGHSVQLHCGKIVESEFRGEKIRFFVDNPEDGIQSFHAIGRFYEEEELALIESYVGRGARILDVGANIGNHMIYFEKFLDPKEVILIEPQPAAIEILRLNASLNNLNRADFSLLGQALGDKAGRGKLETADPKNLGGTVCHYDPEGTVAINRGDVLLGSRQVDFIKIDVEGQEIAVLNGLTNTIKARFPAIFVEVQVNNIETVVSLMAGLGYKRVAEYQRYEGITNFIFKKC